jgi:hypothetical protein
LYPHKRKPDPTEERANMALEMQKIVLEDSARLKRQKTGRASRSDPNQGMYSEKYFFIVF